MLQHGVICNYHFLKMEGLGNEVPIFIYPFDPTDALEAERANKRLKNRLGTKGITILEINLYDITIEILKGRGAWDSILDAEPTLDKAVFREPLQNMLDSETHVVPAISAKLHNVLFITGVGEVFPYVRSHNILNNSLNNLQVAALLSGRLVGESPGVHLRSVGAEFDDLQAWSRFDAVCG